jgi:NAD-dependent SIR2 family protein deacetylase
LPNAEHATETENLVRFIREHPRLAVLTGAGCSTDSGIPEYRDDDGNWKHRQPMQFAEFVSDESKRRRYWAQSFAGWQRISNARPNGAHRAIAELERSGYVTCVITQNVDNLHRAAGSRNVIDLHGVLQHTRCLDCGTKGSRDDYQSRLQETNPNWRVTMTAIAPDGDARISGSAKRFLEQSNALLVVGSSLMVFSGYRFARLANDAGKPIAIVNRGTTRADALATYKLTANCAELLPRAVRRLAS